MKLNWPLIASRVARDADGGMILSNPLYVLHPYSQYRLARGLPFPASCCWNGILAIDARPFAPAGRPLQVSLLEEVTGRAYLLFGSSWKGCMPFPDS